jgi:hypothetical protein
MARDYVEILKRIEAHYPQALGSNTSQDTVLKANITNFANDLIAEIDREQRWSFAFNEPSFVTVPGTQAYALPFPTGASAPLLQQTFIDRMWFEDPATGRVTHLQRLAKGELQRVFGDPVGLTVNVGTPRYYSIETSQTYNSGSPTMMVVLYPCPDATGPTAGNYTIEMSGYFATPPILEVQGTSAVGVTLTVPSGTPTFLTNAGLPTSSAGLGLNVSIRGAGAPGIGGAADTHVTGWSAFPLATTVTLTQAALVVAANTQVFFNSTNWMISYWPKLLIFGILREVASYYGKADEYAIWEQRYQDQLKRLRDYEFDVARSMDAHVVAYAGGNMSALHSNDSSTLVDIRGGVNI